MRNSIGLNFLLSDQGLLQGRLRLPPQSAGMAAFPIFYKTKYYGFLVAEMNKDISTSGEFLADQLARLLCVAEEK